MNIIIKSHIKEVREAKNISVRELATMTGMSKTYISDVENNHKIPTLYTVCMMAEVLEVEPQELFSYRVMEK